MSTKQQLDRIIRHQIYMRGQYTRIANKLDEIIDEIRDEVIKLVRQSKNLLSPRSRNALIRAVDVVIQQKYEEYQELLEGDLEELAEYESEYSSKVSLGLGLAGATIAAGAIASIVKDKPIDGQLLSEMIEKDAQTLRNNIRQQVRIGAASGEGIRQISERIDAQVDKAEKANGTLVRTAGEHTTTSASSETFEKSGAKYFQLSVVLDNRTSAICAALDTSKVYRYDDETAPEPPLHPNCRTQRIPLTDKEPVEQETYGTWLKRQPAGEQKKILGAGRYELYKKGVSVDKFVDQNNHVISLEKLREIEDIY